MRVLHVIARLNVGGTARYITQLAQELPKHGIETFIAGPTGQLMFLKQGLPPNRQEERLIEVDMTPLK